MRAQGNPPGDDNDPDAAGTFLGPRIAPTALELDPAQDAAPPQARARHVAGSAGQWTLDEFRRARAGGQLVSTVLAELQAEVDALNTWIVLSACLTEGRMPVVLPPPRVERKGRAESETACADDEAASAWQADVDELNAGESHCVLSRSFPRGTGGPLA